MATQLATPRTPVEEGGRQPGDRTLAAIVLGVLGVAVLVAIGVAARRGAVADRIANPDVEGAPRPVAVNPDPRESDLRGLAAEELARWSASAAPRPVAAPEPAAGEGAPAPAPTSVSHTGLFLALLLGLLCVELGVANWQLRPGRAKLS